MKQLIVSNITFTKKKQEHIKYTAEAYKAIGDYLHATQSKQVKVLLLIILLEMSNRSGLFMVVKQFIVNDYPVLAVITLPIYRTAKEEGIDAFINKEVIKHFYIKKSAIEDKGIIRDALMIIFPNDFEKYLEKNPVWL